MSLQVWMPLNGTIKNFGLSDVTASLINDPKVVASNRGECYNLNPNNENNQCIQVAINNMPQMIRNTFSIAFWVYHRETSSRSILFGNHALDGTLSFNIEKKATSNLLRIYMNQDPDYTANCVLEENSWIHIAITKTPTELKVYKNGECVATRTNSSEDSWSAANGTVYRIGRDSRSEDTALNGMINDLRIYDHVLSKKEISSLAQGLLLNYSFDDLYMAATTNLINKADGNFVKNSSSVWHAGLSCPYTYVTPGKTYTFSCEIRASQPGYTVYFDTNCTDEGGVYSGNDASMHSIVNNAGTAIPSDGTWVKAWCTVGVKSDAGKPAIHHTLCPQVSSADNITFYYRNLQLEEGPTATPFVPFGNPREGLVSDVSGWGRHGQLVKSSCYVSNDTPLGDYSLFLNGTSSERAHVLAPLNLSDIKTYTFASYIKINSWGAQTSGLISADRVGVPENYTSSPLHHRDSHFDIAVVGNTTDKIGPTYQRLSCNTGDIPVGTWVHFAVTFDGKTATLYIDGEKRRSTSFSTNVTLSPCSNLYISYSCAGSLQRVTNALWSDFRVYSTCLSASNIKKLMQNQSAIDKNNNLFCYALNEEINKTHNIDTKGIVHANGNEEINIYPGVQYNASQMNVIYNYATDVFKDYGFNTCTKFAATNTSVSAFRSYSYLLPTSYYTPNGVYSFSCYAYVPSECNANLRIHLEQNATWVKNYQNTKSNINDTTKDKVIKVTGTIKANSNGQIYIMFYPNPNQANIFTRGYFLVAGLTIVPGEEIPHPRIERTSHNLIQRIEPIKNMTANGDLNIIGTFTTNDTYSWLHTESLELNKMYRLSFNVSNLPANSFWDWKLWNNANYTIRVDRTGQFYYTFIPKASLLPQDYSLSRFLWDDGNKSSNPSGSVYFNNFSLVECIAQPHHGLFETNKAAIHPSYIEMNSIYEN